MDLPSFLLRRPFRTQAIVSAVCVMFIQGCFTAVSIEPAELETYTDQTIFVTTRDDRRFEFSPGEYSVTTDELGNKAVHGKAKLFAHDGPQYQWFEGDIPFENILRITTPETTIWFYLAIILLGLTLLYGIFLGMAFRGGKVG